MFGKNKNNSNVSHDIDVMMQMMDKVIQGEYDDIDVTAFDNPAYGEKLNELIHLRSQITTLLCVLMRLWNQLAIIRM